MWNEATTVPETGIACKEVQQESINPVTNPESTFYKSRYPSVHYNLVSEVWDRILSDLVRCTMATEQGLEQIMERLLARQEEATAQIAAKQE
jgi:hypothetical protein